MPVVKRALKYDAQRNAHVDCACNQAVAIDGRFNLCQRCKLVYDARGWILGRLVGQQNIALALAKALQEWRAQNPPADSISFSCIALSGPWPDDASLGDIIQQAAAEPENDL